jgi:hypothetical protein
VRTTLLFLLLTSPVLAQDRAAMTAAVSACGQANTKFAVKQDQTQPPSKPESGKALVYVIEDMGQWDRGCLGGCITIRVGLDGAWIGANQGNTHFSFSVLPGEHHLCANWQSSLAERSSMYSLADFNAEAGKVYYFRTRVWASGNVPFLDLDPVNNDEGRYQVAASPPAISNPKK